MKRLMKILALAAFAAAFTTPALAQKQECNDENKAAWYKTFYDNFRGDENQQKTAYDAGKTYHDSCPADPNDKQLAYVENWLKKYEHVKGEADAGKNFEKAVQDKNYGNQFTYGKQLLTSDPDNVDVNTQLGIIGLADPSHLNESVPYAQKALSLINGGKTPKVYTKEQALGYLNWTIGKSKLTSAPADAINDLVKAAKVEGDAKKNSALYIDLAAAYESGPRAKYSTDYKASLNPDQTETAQSKVILENLNRVIDAQIDAMARAAASESDANKKKAIMGELTELYKYRNKTATDANVSELVANVMSKPIPDAPTPITSLPNPGTTPGTGAVTGPASGTTGKPAGNNMTNGSQTSGTAKPAASPTPMVKKPRR